MAGVGFELKKYLYGRTFSQRIRAYWFGGIVSIGPMLLCIFSIIIIQIFLNVIGVEFSKRELFNASVTYPFIFSNILTSLISMILTRYVADKFFCNDVKGLLNSLYGAISICIVFSGLIGLIFYYRSPLNFNYKMVSYILFMLLNIIWLQGVYLSTVNNYYKVFYSFLIGVFSLIITAILLIKVFKFEPCFSLLFSLDIGIFVIIISFDYILKNYFESDDNNNYYEFLRYLEKHPKICLTNFLYIFGLFVQNLMFWLSDSGITIANTYVVSPSYDITTFYASLSITPTLVMFVVLFETSFYEKYKQFYTFILEKGNLKEILSSKSQIVEVFWNELFRIMELQLFYSILFVLLGVKILPTLGFLGMNMGVFVILTFAFYFISIMFVFLMTLMYFDDTVGTLLVTFVLFITNIFFTGATIWLGNNFYGLGFFFSSFVTLFVAYLRFNYFIKNIEYQTFCSQPIIPKTYNGYINKAINLWYKNSDNKNLKERSTKHYAD